MRLGKKMLWFTSNLIVCSDLLWCDAEFIVSLCILFWSFLRWDYFVVFLHTFAKILCCFVGLYCNKNKKFWLA
jgi:hypothetical protein